MSGPETNTSSTIFEKCGGKLVREGKDTTPWDPYGIPLPKLLEDTISQPHMEWAYWSSYQESFEAYTFYNATEEGKLVPWNEIILFYTSCILSILKYALPLFFYTLPMDLKKDLECIERRALAITCPGLSYRDALVLSNIVSTNDYITSLCNKTFTSTVNDLSHRLHSRRFVVSKCKTERFKNSLNC